MPYHIMTGLWLAVLGLIAVMALWWKVPSGLRRLCLGHPLLFDLALTALIIQTINLFMSGLVIAAAAVWCMILFSVWIVVERARLGWTAVRFKIDRALGFPVPTMWLKHSEVREEEEGEEEVAGG